VQKNKDLNLGLNLTSGANFCMSLSVAPEMSSNIGLNFPFLRFPIITESFFVSLWERTYPFFSFNILSILIV